MSTLIDDLDQINEVISVLTAYGVYSKYIELYKMKKGIWTREIFSENERQNHGFYSQIFQIMKGRDSEQFIKATRMNVNTFELLFALIKHRLNKNSLRRPVEAECRLVLTLLYLSQGASCYTLSWVFLVSKDSFEVDTFVPGLWWKDGPSLPQAKLFRRYKCTNTAFEQREIMKDYIQDTCC